MTRRDPWGLTETERRTVVLYGVLGHCQRIAEVMEKTVGSVRTTLHRANHKMGVNCTAQAVLRLERWKRGWSAARSGKDVA